MNTAKQSQRLRWLGLGFLLLLLLCLGFGLVKNDYATPKLSDEQIVQRYFGRDTVYWSKKPLIINCPQSPSQLMFRTCVRVVGAIIELIPLEDRVTRLELGGMGLTSLPPEVEQLPNLSVLR